MFDFFFSFFVPLSVFLASFFAFLDSLSFLAIVPPIVTAVILPIFRATRLLFEVPRAVPTIRLPPRLRRRVPHDAIDRGQDGAGECQRRGDKDHGFGHATTLITASASAHTPIHSPSTAIVPKATRPMPVIASLIGV
jgi:hypothetical protein